MPNTPDSTGATPSEPQEITRKPRFGYQAPKIPLEPETPQQRQLRILLNTVQAREQAEKEAAGDTEPSARAVLYTGHEGRPSTPEELKRAKEGLPIDPDSPTEETTSRQSHARARDVREQNRARTAAQKSQDQDSSRRPVQHVPGAYIQPWNRHEGNQGRDRQYRNNQGRGGHR